MMPADRPDPLMTAEDVAEQCQTSLRTVRRWIATGQLPVIRLGRAVRVRPEALKVFLNKHER